MQTYDIDLDQEISKNEQSEPYVIILGKPETDQVQYFVCGEKTLICESKSILDSIVDLVSSYYLFTYPTSISGPYLSFQHHVFNIKDEQLSPPCLKKLIGNLSSL